MTSDHVRDAVPAASNVIADRTLQIPVSGGTLTVGVWGRGSPVVLAIHGITASHRCWALVAAQLGAGTLVAPDLRGRGGSSDLPGPYGMASHAADCVAVLNALNIPDAVVVGHSMGGFVAATIAHHNPTRVHRLVLVDGGAPLPPPNVAEGASPDEVLDAVIGPAVRRLSMRFPSREAYRKFWREHPAFGAAWNPTIESYVDYDLVRTTRDPQLTGAGGGPANGELDSGDLDSGDLRSRVSLDAVREDSIDLHLGEGPREAFHTLRDHGIDTLFLRAERGLLDEPVPLYPDPEQIARQIPVDTVPDTNHYTIVLDQPGARAIARSLTA